MMAGSCLPENVRIHLETLFRADLTSVRIHRSPEVGTACTYGEDVHLSPDLGGQNLADVLGHEIAHVLQQRRGRLRSETRAALESEAIDAGRAVARGRSVRLPLGRGGRATPEFQGYSVVQDNQRAGFAGGAVAVVNGQRSVVAPFTTDSFVGQDKPGFQASSFLAARHGQPVLSSAAHATVTLRISQNGQMAIEDANILTRQPKVFYATQAVVNASNARLTAYGATVRLVPDAAGAAQRRITVGGNTLLRVTPRNVTDGTAGLTMSIDQPCNATIDHILGTANRVLRWGGLDVTPHPVIPEYHIARALLPAPQPAVLAAAGAALVTSMRNIVIPYAALTRAPTAAFTNLLQTNHLNAHADPAVGEGYLTMTLIAPTAGTANAGPPTMEDHSALVGGLPRILHKDLTWSTHWGGVVAADGDDVVTLENYARSREDDQETVDTRYYFQMYHQGPGGSWHEAWSSVPLGPIPGAPMVPPLPPLTLAGSDAVTRVPVSPGAKSFANPLTVRVTVPDSRLDELAGNLYPNVDAVKDDHNLVAGAASQDAEYLEVMKGLRYANLHIAARQSGARARVQAWRDAIAAAIAADAHPGNHHVLAVAQDRLATMSRGVFF